jgi:recombination protein RecA
MAKKKEMTIQDFHEDVNRECKTSFITFDEKKEVDFIDTGFPELNIVIGGKPDAGYARGTFVELFGPEGSGKTWMVTKFFKSCQDLGLKCALYDAEGTYSQEFSKLHGLKPDFLSYSDEDKAEEIFEQIEQLCIKNKYDVIALDSLAGLVPKSVADDDMGKLKISPLAACIGRCIPRLNSAVKKSKTVLILINQLRDAVGAYGNPEITPGGRTIKFFASLRLDVRKAYYTKTDRPDLYDLDGRQIGHVLKVKAVKNKVSKPGLVCELDLMYQMNRPVIDLIKQSIEMDIIERNRDENGEIKGKKLTFGKMSFSPKKKQDYEEVYLWLKENAVLCELIDKHSKKAGLEEQWEAFIQSGDVTEEEVSNYLAANSEPEEAKSE